MGRVPGRLLSAGFRALGEVLDRTDDQLLEVPGVGADSVRRIRRRIAAIQACHRNPDLLARRTDQPIPRAPSELLERLLRASSVHEEVKALTGGLSERDAGMFLARIRAQGEPQPTLDELAERWEISRERVRQILEHHTQMLERSGLRLPLASRLIRIADEEGGLVATPKLVQMARDRGLSLESSLLLHALPFLGDMGLIEPIRYVDEVDSWVTARGERWWIESGLLERNLQRTRRVANEYFRRASCVEKSVLAESCILSPWQRTRALGVEYERIDEIEGFAIPIPAVSSRLTRAVKKMLAVCPSLPMSDIAEGLARLRQQIEGIPPVSVLEHILAHHPSFEVDAAARVHPAPQASLNGWLSGSERAFVAIVDGQGGVAKYSQVLQAMEQEGYSRHTAAVLMGRSPFLRKPGVGLYSLRKSTIPWKQIAAKTAR